LTREDTETEEGHHINRGGLSGFFILCIHCICSHHFCEGSDDRSAKTFLPFAQAGTHFTFMTELDFFDTTDGGASAFATEDTLCRKCSTVHEGTPLICRINNTMKFPSTVMLVDAF
jgi:hypothetical protein